MSNPWDDDPIVVTSAKPWAADPVATQGAPQAAPTSYKGAILPFSRDTEGHVSFDPSAGVLGMLRNAWSGVKDAATLPGDVYAGRTDPFSDEGIERAMNLATFATPVTPAARMGGIGLGFKAAKVDAPSSDALRQAARTGYDAVRDSGVDYDGAAVSTAMSSLRGSLEGDGILQELAPKSFSVLGKLENAPYGSVAPVQNLEAARRAFGQAGRDFSNPTDQLAASRLKEGLDAFLSDPPSGAVISGDAQATAKALMDARGNYAAASRSDTLKGIGEAADLRAAVSHSGQNGDNATRQRIASLLLNPKASAGFSDSELESLEGVAKGTPLGNAARFVGNLAGGGGGLGAVVSGGAAGTAGGVVGGPFLGAALGAGVPTAGMLAKALGARMTRSALGSVDDAVRMRSPLAEALLAGAPQTAVNPGSRAAVAKALALALEKDGKNSTP